MASGKLLRQLIKSGAEGNLNGFREASEEVIREERAKNHHLLANDLEKILYGRPPQLSAGRGNLEKYLPKDKERDLPLVQLKEPQRRLEDVVLSKNNAMFIDEILEEHHRRDILVSYGLKPADKLLFYGPPGCGKTLTAEVLASELAVPLVIVRLDSVVSSFLGETAANIRQVFDFISRVPSVTLFDEFDAIAKERSDGSDHGELKRVVNSVLQMLDDYQGKSVLIGATNHETILDTAIWRRFEEVVVFDVPDKAQTKHLLSVKLRGLRRDFEHDDDHVASLFAGMSHADIERIIRRAAKEMVLQGKQFLTIKHIEMAALREDARSKRMGRIGSSWKKDFRT